jgi:hypothetical protein
MTLCASNPSCTVLVASANQDENNCVTPVVKLRKNQNRQMRLHAGAFAICHCKRKEPRVCGALLNQTLAVCAALLTGLLARLIALLTGLVVRLLPALLAGLLTRILGLLAGLLARLVALLSLLRLLIVLLIRHFA